MVTQEGKHHQPWQPSFTPPLSNIVPLRQDNMNTATPHLVPLWQDQRKNCVFTARKYKHSDPKCCACTTWQDFLPLQQDKIQTYLPVLIEIMKTQQLQTLCLYSKTRPRPLCVYGTKIQTQWPRTLCLKGKTRPLPFCLYGKTKIQWQPWCPVPDLWETHYDLFRDALT